MRGGLVLLVLAGCVDDAPADAVDTDEGPPPRRGVDEAVAGGAPARDPEFFDDLVVWQAPDTGGVWVAEVDPATGQWIPASGRGRRLGVALPMARNPTGRPATHNGPEWGVDRDGPSVFFTVDADGLNQPVEILADGTPQPVAAGDEHRSGVLPQVAPDNERLAVLYFLGELAELRAAWRWVGEDVDHPFPISFTVEPGPRWIDGEDALVSPVRAPEHGDLVQVARVDLATEDVTFLTTDDGHKSDPFVFRAAGTRWLLTTVADTLPADFLGLVPTQIAVYRDDGDGFVRHATFGVDARVPGGPHVHYGAKPFEVDGEPWITFVTTAGRTRGDATHVWVSRLDGSDLTRITEGEALRADAEVVLVEGRPLLYYLQITGGQHVRVVRDFLPD